VAPIQVARQERNRDDQQRGEDGGTDVREAAEAPRDTRRPVHVVTECPNMSDQTPKHDECHEETAPERGHCEDERRDTSSEFGSPPDEDTRMNVREPKSERSVVTATTGNRATPYHHELDMLSNADVVSSYGGVMNPGTKRRGPPASCSHSRVRR